MISGWFRVGSDGFGWVSFLSITDILSLKVILLDRKSSVTNRKSQIFNKIADQIINHDSNLKLQIKDLNFNVTIKFEIYNLWLLF